VSSDSDRGFGPGFEKDVAAILAAAERGILYMREVRENLAKAGMIIYDHVDLPDVEPPKPSAEEIDDELQLIGVTSDADDTALDEEADNE
jgi:hypothetical protein